MTPRTYGRARDLFARARRLPRDGRTAWLRGHCEDRGTLLAEVRALLAQDDGGGRSFLGTPAVNPTQRDELPVNGYGVMRPLHTGATCALYLARQRHPVRRNVVIKTPKPDADNPHRARARLNAEVRALAATDHPNVVTLLDAGATRDGRPFLAMRHVYGGVAITRFCDAHRWSLRRRLEMFLHACEAVRHVHERGVVHGGLCPDHLLVALHGRMPHLTLVGFGSAMLTSESFPDDRPDESEPSTYAPPERLARAGRGGADPRGDVYSLGVILRDLITPAPATPRSARARLNALVCRATQEDPSRRHQTVDQLAEDVRACLATHRPRATRIALTAALIALLVVSAAVLRHLV